MSLFQKKVSKEPTSTPWHVDFLDKKALPDVGVVPIGFIAICCVGAVLAILLAVILYFQFNISNLNTDIIELQKFIDKRDANNKKMLGYSADFLKKGKVIGDLHNAILPLTDLTEVIFSVVASKPNTIFLSQIKCKPQAVSDQEKKPGSVVMYEIHLEGSAQELDDDKAIGCVSEYKNSLTHNLFLRGHSIDVTIDDVKRNGSSKLIEFIISISLKLS
ncbi:MAG: hypothetical protein A2007_01450 [Verrucomicrobia bacterium GWC2_42_7]|nr:MAG: hypothetical protein A2007_01450 [Verrucomicrobia bacterium GWC2_42_7]